MMKSLAMLAASLCALPLGSAAGSPSLVLSTVQQALVPPMKRHETDFVTIDLPERSWFEDESSLGQVSLYGGNSADGNADTIAFELTTVNAETVEEQVAKAAAHPMSMFNSRGWEERRRQTIGDGILIAGVGNAVGDAPARPIALFVAPDGEGGVVELTVKAEYGTSVPPDELFALAEAMAASMVVEELPDETTYAAFRSTQFGEIAEVPRKDGAVDTDALAALTIANLDAASTKAAAFSDAFDTASEEQWSPERVLADLIPLAQAAATEHRAMATYADAWDEAMAMGDPQAPTMRALGLVGRTGYSFLFDLAGHVTRVAELKERGREEALADFRRKNAPELEEERDLYAYALAAYAAAKAGEAAPDAPSLDDTERRNRAAAITAAADDVRLAQSDPATLTAKYAEADAKRFGTVRSSSGEGTRKRVGRAGFYPSVNFNPAGLDPFSNVNVVRVYGGMSLDPWD